MGEIFIVNDGANSFVKKLITELNIKSLDYHELRDDVEADEFIVTQFNRLQIDKLLIPVSLGEVPSNQMGFKLGLHIRLSSEISRGVLVPIIFISNQSLETLLLARAERYGLIAVTEGSMLCNEDAADINANVSALEPIRARDFNSKFLSQLIINKPETKGPHSLANEWGVYQLDKVAQLKSLGISAPAFLTSKTLYFKFLRAKNNFAGLVQSSPGTTPAPGSSVAAPNTIDALSKKILYIDDEGYKGWTSALNVIFKGGALTVETGLGLTETQFFANIRRQIAKDWDLILLDLRLLPLQEDVAGIVLPITSYSGTKILKEIKDLNEGNQVIIFTASNKAWNMKQLLELKADGYYVKESPEYLIPDDISLKNYEVFKDQVTSCFERIYLKSIFIEHRNAMLQTACTHPSFLSLSAAGVKRSFDLIRLGQLESAYLNYFQIIEHYLDLVFHKTHKSVVDLGGVQRKIKPGANYLLKYYDDAVNGPFMQRRNSSQPLKYTALCKLSFIMAFKFSKDNAYLKGLGTLVKIRNDIAHTGSSALFDKAAFFELINIIHTFRANP